MKLFTNKDSPLGKKVLVVAQYVGAELEVPEFVLGHDNTTPEFLEKNPIGKIPVLETEEGCIFESNAICRFLARTDENTQLFGQNDFEKALVDQWLDFTNSEIDLPAKVWIFPILGLLDNDQAATNRAKSDIRKVLGILNEHLLNQTFLVGERLTLADIVVALHLLPLYTKVLDPGFRKAFGNTNRWFETCVNQPQWKAVLGEVVPCTKAELPPKGAADKPKEQHEKKEKEKKPQQEKKPQPEKKPQQEKKPKHEDEDEEEEEKEAKPRSALDLLPKSSMEMDEWKRFYSNNDTKAAMEWFWQHLDKEGYGLWFSEYRFNPELESLLKTCNLIGGWFQRLDRLRRYGFGNAVIFKSADDAHHEISTCWLLRGTEMPAEMKECDDYELYEWKKVENTDDPEIRTKIGEYWSWEGNFGGRKFVQGKVFK